MSNKLRSNLYALMSVFFLAASFLVSRFALTYFNPLPLGFLRCFIASIALFIIAKFNNIRKPLSLKHITLFFLSGASGFGVYLIVFNIGMQTITSATSAIIIATTPILTALAASVFYKEKLSIVGYFSIAAAFCGVLIIILWNGILSVNVGVLWTVVAFLFCAYNILSRKLCKIGYTSIEVITYSMITAAIILSLYSVEGFSQLANADISYIGALLYLSIGTSTLGYFLLNKGIQIAEKTSDVTNYLFANPLIASILGYILHWEKL